MPKNCVFRQAGMAFQSSLVPYRSAPGAWSRSAAAEALAAGESGLTSMVCPRAGAASATSRPHAPKPVRIDGPSASTGQLPHEIVDDDADQEEDHAADEADDEQPE